MINMTAEEDLQKETLAEEKKRLAAEKKLQQETEAKAAKAAKDARKAEEKAKKAADKAVKEAKKAEEKAKKEAENRPQTLKDLTEDYNLKEVDGLFIPGYFHQKARYDEVAEEQVDVYHANNFLFGMEIFAEQGSCSAKITYVGPNRRYTLHNVQIAKREARPTQNNWKTFNSPIRMFKGKEHNSKIKDPKIIRDLMFSRGGGVNFKIRFVQDKEFTPEEVKKKVFHKDPVRLRNLNYRIKKDHAKMGIKPVLRDKKEALLLLKDLKLEVKGNTAKHVLQFLQEEIGKYIAVEEKQKQEAAKD